MNEWMNEVTVGFGRMMGWMTWMIRYGWLDADGCVVDQRLSYMLYGSLVIFFILLCDRAFILIRYFWEF